MSFPPVTLPFPHGSGAGQIGNGTNFDDNDTPGYPGGRFVGFGEPGTSRITNRAAWALSTNIDTIFTAVLSMPISINAALGFTVGGSGIDRLQISGVSVFCGDSSYPGSPPTDPEGMHALFSVLDNQYNPLVATDGSEVRVYAVYDAADAVTVYQTGYVTGPYVHFCTVNPATGAIVTADYTIPSGTVGRLVYGVQGTLKDLPYDHPDAFTRFRALTGEEVPGGVVLQDGTRAMTGSLDIGNNSIVNCGFIVGSISSGGPEPLLGIGTNLEMVTAQGNATEILIYYSYTGSEASAVVPLSAIQLGDIDEGYSVGMVLYADPSVGTSAPAKLVLTVNNSTGVSAIELAHDFGLNALSPSIDITTDLGSAAQRWNGVWAYDIHTTYASTVELDIGTSSISVHNTVTGGYSYPVLSENGVDFMFYTDFASQYIICTSASPDIDSNYTLTGTGGQGLSSPGLGAGEVYGRTTIVYLATEAGPGKNSNVVGPAVVSLTDNAFSLSIGLALIRLNGGSITYTIQSGFGNGAFGVATVYCYFYMNTLNQLFVTWNDGVNSGNVNTGTTLSVGSFYDLGLVFTPTSLYSSGSGQLFLNGSALGSSFSFYPGATALTSWPIVVSNTGDAVDLYLDYIDIHSEGHLPRT